MKYARLMCMALVVAACSFAQAGVVFSLNGSGDAKFDDTHLTGKKNNLYQLDTGSQVAPYLSNLVPAKVGKHKLVALNLLEVGGDFVFSFAGPKWTVDGTTFYQNELIKYNVSSNTLERFWTPPNLPTNKNISTVLMPSNDSSMILFTLASNTTITTGTVKQKFYDHEVISWTATGGYSEYFDASQHGGPGKITALTMDGEGNLLLAGKSWKGHSTGNLYSFSGTSTWTLYSADGNIAAHTGRSTYPLSDVDVTDRLGAVPEPATLALAGFGLLALLRRRARR